MKPFLALVKRNVKLFFKDKGMFFTALITPGILLVLYATFLGNVYKDSFLSALPEGLNMAEDLINGCVSAQLTSSILAVSCVTVAFCSNMLMVQDKVTGSIRDLTITPVRKSTLALSYYFASLLSTLIICFVAMGLCLIYMGFMGFYMSGLDVVLLLSDVVLLVTFGTALSSIVNFFLSTQGQISAVGSIISAGYGFICGAYMPISQFSPALQKVVAFLPGTYGTTLVRNHAMGGVFREMERVGFPQEAVDGMKDTVDFNFYFFGHPVSVGAMYAVLGGTVLLLIAGYVLLNMKKRHKRS